MRIIAGEFRGKKLATPKGDQTRPTSDRLRERLFNILSHKLENGFQGIRVADIFAGTGALGLEALSRGADYGVFVEKHRESIALIKTNIDGLKSGDKTKILSCDARNLPPEKEPFDLIFMDPPYGHDLSKPTLDSAIEKGWVDDKTIIVLELAKEDPLEPTHNLEIIDERIQGKTKALMLKILS